MNTLLLCLSNDAASVAAVEALTAAVLPVRYSPRFYGALVAAPHCFVAAVRRAADGVVLGALTARIELDAPAAAFVRETTASPDDDGSAPVPESDDALVHFLTAFLHWLVPPPPPPPPRAKRLYLLTLAVRDDARRSGVASRLVEAALAWARGQAVAGGCQIAALHVKADNAAALAFYARLGFVQTGPALVDYYVIDGVPCDGLYLSRRLEPAAAVAIDVLSPLTTPPPTTTTTMVAPEPTGVLAWLRALWPA